jgi:hypothetical protein
MVLRFKTTTFVAAALLGVLLVSAGCAKKTGIERQARTTSTMQDVESNIQQAVMQIGATNASLENLMQAGQSADLKNPFAAYSENVSKVEDRGNNLMSQLNDMSTQGNEYFEEWRKEGTEYTNPDIRRLSEEQRVQLRRTFNDVAEASIGVRGDLNKYLSEVKEIQTYLSNNLTSSSVEALAPVAERTLMDGRNLINNLKPVQTAINQARSQMMTGGAAAGGTSMGTGSGSGGM